MIGDPPLAGAVGVGDPHLDTVEIRIDDPITVSIRELGLEGDLFPSGDHISPLLATLAVSKRGAPAPSAAAKTPGGDLADQCSDGTPPHERYKQPSITGRGMIYQQESEFQEPGVLTGSQFNHHTLLDEPEEVVDPH